MRPENETYGDEMRWPKSVERFIRHQASGFTVNICAGATDIGDVRVDLQTEQQPSTDGLVKASFPRTDDSDTPPALPLQAGIADTVISDPPWRNMPKETKEKLFEELIRLCKPGGAIIHNATWIPDHPRVDREDIVPRVDHDLRSGIPNVSYIAYFRVHKDSPEQPYTERRGFEGRDPYPLPEHIRQQQVAAYRALESRDTDHRIVDPAQTAYECVQCGSPDLRHYPDPHEQLYRCPECGFRNTINELVKQASDGSTEDEHRTVPA